MSQRRRTVVTVAALVSVAGVWLTVQTQAASYVVATEAEAGTVTGRAAVRESVGVSDGRSVAFGASTGSPGGYAVSLRDHGAKCDGVTNDQPALESAVDDIRQRGNGTVIIPAGNCRLVHTESKIFTYIEGPITFRGESSASQLSLDSDVKAAYREMFRIGGGNGVVFEGFRMVRMSDVYGMFIRMDGAMDGLTIKDMVLDGRRDTIGGADIHGIGIFGQAGQRMTNSKMVNTTIRNVNFGLFQPSAVRSVTDGWLVDRCTFIGNYNDDLEFNAPESTMTNISVTNSTFRDNKMPPGAYAAGFAIGYANVQHGLIKNNTIENYGYDGIHIEDRSADITVEDNRLKNVFLNATDWSSYIFIINQSRDIRVRNNSFDTTGNQNRLWVVYAGRGGGAGDVSNITITGNTFRLRPQAVALGEFGASGTDMRDNTVINLP